MRLALLKKLLEMKRYSVAVEGVEFGLFHPAEFGIHRSSDGRFNWEPALTQAVLEQVNKKPEGVFIDVGASFGYFSHLAWHALKGQRVHAFEPYWPRRAILRLNNMVAGADIAVIPKYVGDVTSGDKISLDDYCAAKGIAPDFIKMDIEGAEYFALKGMKNICRQYGPTLFIEVHERIMREDMKVDPGVVLRITADWGYTIRYLNHHQATGKLVYRDEKPNIINYEVVCTKTGAPESVV